MPAGVFNFSSKDAYAYPSPVASCNLIRACSSPIIHLVCNPCHVCLCRLMVELGIRLSVLCLLIKLVVFLHKACINMFDPFFSSSSVPKASVFCRIYVFYLRD